MSFCDEGLKSEFESDNMSLASIGGSLENFTIDSTYIAGVMYLNFLKEFFNAGSKVEEMTDEAIKLKMNECIDNEDIKDMVTELMTDYKKRKKAREITGTEKLDDMQEE